MHLWYSLLMYLLYLDNVEWLNHCIGLWLATHEASILFATLTLEMVYRYSVHGSEIDKSCLYHGKIPGWYVFANSGISTHEDMSRVCHSVYINKRGFIPTYKLPSRSNDCTKLEFFCWVDYCQDKVRTKDYFRKNCNRYNL